MQKQKYVLLWVTAISAIIMVGANASQQGWSFSFIDWTLGTTSQTSLENLAKPPFPLVSLSRSARGEEAIRALGDKIPEVARWYGITGEELSQKLKRDKDLVVDKNGRLLYEDSTTITEAGSAVQNSNLSQNGYLPLEQTFSLHSRPGSSKTIYLDFTGHFFQAGKSVWISTDFNAPAYDTDGSPTTFNDNERMNIQETWLKMAEDFAAYDVDVTTEEPTMDKLERASNSDTIYGNRILFTPNGAAFGYGSYGGVSYVGIFDDVGEYSKISLVFPANLAQAGRYMGECGSHENGHALGLYHKGATDGTEYYEGQGDWAPIMGNSYYRNVTQWSKGEYANANGTADELQTMLSYGVQYATDDFGNSVSTAGNAEVSGNSISSAGVIGRTGDVDYIKFNTAAGQVNISANVAVWSNVDIELGLYDSAGRLISSSNPAGLPASVSATVDGGTYYITVKGVGAGNPVTDGYSNYASLGQYYISGTIVGTNDNPPVAQASASPTAGSAPLTVAFSSVGSIDPDGGPLTYTWDFGDNTSSTEQNPTKTYSNTGSFTAMLTVRDQTNLSGSKSVVISAANQPPVAFFTIGSGSMDIPATVNVDASGSTDNDGTIASYTWTFGDGTIGSGQIASHVYTTPGSFPITLTVTDNGGLTATKTVSITTIDPLAINAPSSLSGTSGGKVKNQVTLKWADNSGNESNFVIERALSVRQGSPIYQHLVTVGPNTTTYTNISVPAGTYYYRVRAYNANLNKYSNYSNAVSVRVR